MRKFESLIEKWEEHGRGALSSKPVAIHLSEDDQVKVSALCEMYPKMDRESLLRDLVSVALKQFEEALPYRQGTQVIALDEEGDEIFEDTGSTPIFLTLSKKYRERIMNPTFE